MGAVLPSLTRDDTAAIMLRDALNGPARATWLADLAVAPWSVQKPQIAPSAPCYKAPYAPDYRTVLLTRVVDVLTQLGPIERPRTRIEIASLYWDIVNAKKRRNATTGEELAFYAAACSAPIAPQEVEPKNPAVPAHAAGKFPFNRPAPPLSVTMPRIEAMLAPLSDRRKRAASMFANEGDPIQGAP